MSDKIYLDTTIKDAFKNAGLKVTNPRDVKLVKDAIQRSQPGTSISEITRSAASQKSGTMILEDYFEQKFPIENRPQRVEPKPKTGNESGTEILERHFSEQTDAEKGRL